MYMEASDQRFNFARGFLFRIISAAFSAIIIVGAFVFPEGTFGIIEASTTLSPEIDFTLKSRINKTMDKIFYIYTNEMSYN